MALGIKLMKSGSIHIQIMLTRLKFIFPRIICRRLCKRSLMQKGNLLEEVCSDGKGKELKKTTFVYDSKFRMVEMAEYFSSPIEKDAL